MAHITVTIEGDVDEVVATIRQMAGRGIKADRATEEETPAAASPVEPDPAPAEAPEAPAPLERPAVPDPEKSTWTTGYVNIFWQTLSDTARQAMLRVSRSPNHSQKRAQLMHTLQLSQRELSGSLSSQGHSLNRLKRRRDGLELPRPLTYDRVEDVYVLDADFAKALRELGIS